MAHTMRCLTFALIVLSLVACGTPSGDPSTDTARVITATVQNPYTGSMAGLEPILNDNPPGFLGSGSINADGSFTFSYAESLTDDQLSADFLSYICGHPAPTVDALGTMGSLLTTTTGDAELFMASSADVHFSPPQAGETIVSRVYVNQDVRVDTSCAFDGTRLDLNLKEGWNIVVHEVGVSATTGTPPANVAWYVREY